jgi:hypothetical protein
MEENEVILDFNADQYFFVLTKYADKSSTDRYLKLRGFTSSFKVSI